MCLCDINFDGWFLGERKKSDSKKMPVERDGVNTLDRWKVAVRPDMTSC